MACSITSPATWTGSSPKHELLDHVWPEVHVGDAVLKVAIREIRSALGDDSAAPRFVQTARRIGYRFVAPVSHSAPFDSAPSDDRARTFEIASAPTVNVATTPLVGRDRALQALHAALVRTLAGQRQVVFVVGEGGIGKTSIVDTFLRQVERDARAWIAKGQCLEHAGGAEAYLPVLDALGRLARHPGRGRVTALLRQVRADVAGADAVARRGTRFAAARDLWRDARTHAPWRSPRHSRR